jgi:hypothetical protein
VKVTNPALSCARPRVNDTDPALFTLCGRGVTDVVLKGVMTYWLRVPLPGGQGSPSPSPSGGSKAAGVGVRMSRRANSSLAAPLIDQAEASVAQSW